MDRYSEAEQMLLEQYFDRIRLTRKSGKLSENIRKRQLEYFSKYPKNIVLEAIKIHLKKYPGMREDYTRGILRNLAREAEHGHRGHGRAVKSDAGTMAERNRSAADAIASRL